MKIQRFKPQKFKHVQDVNFQHAFQMLLTILKKNI